MSKPTPFGQIRAPIVDSSGFSTLPMTKKFQQWEALLASATTVVGNPVNVSAQGFAAFNSAAPVNIVPALLSNAGTYRISLYLVITTTFVGCTAITGTFGWTDDQGAHMVTYTSAALTAGTTIIGSQVIRSSGTAPITFTPSKTGGAATAGAASYTALAELLI